MNQFEELHYAAHETKTIQQADSLLDSVDALASQSLLKSHNAVRKAQAEIASEENEAIILSYD
jgi:hypothetical protein